MLTCREYTPYISAYFAEYQLYWKAADHLGGGGGVACTPCTLLLDLVVSGRSGTQVTFVLTIMKFSHKHSGCLK